MKIAVFTHVHDEPIFLPIWLKYYSQFFSAANIYVIHLIKPILTEFDNSILEMTGFHRIDMQDEQRHNYDLVVTRVQNLQEQLLKDYDWVLFAEVDEIIFSYKNTSHFRIELETNLPILQGRIVVPRGMEIVQNLDSESDIDLSKSILSQRSWWYPSNLYSKPLLSSIPVHYCHGFHSCNEKDLCFYNSGLLNIHLHKMDYKISEHRKAERKKYDVEGQFSGQCGVGQGYQHTITGEEHRKWWDLSVDTLQPVEKTLIPEAIKASQLF